MASLAQLGVAIESGRAKEGAAQVKQELAGIATEAKKTATAVAGATQALGQSRTATTAAATAATSAAQGSRDLASATTSVASAAKIAADAAAAESKVFADLFGQIRAGKAAVAEMQAATTAVATTMSTATTAGGGFAAALSPLAGPIGIGVVTVLSLLPAVFDKIREQSAKAREEQRKYREELGQLSTAALEAARATELAYQQRIRSTPMTRGRRETLLAESNARLQPIEGAIGSQQTAAAMAFSKALQDNQREILNTAERITVLRREGKLAAEAYAAAAAQWDASSKSALTLGQALAQGSTDAQRLLTSQRQMATATKTLTDATEGGARAAREKAKADAEALRQQEAFAAFIRKGKDYLKEEAEEREKAKEKLDKANATIGESISLRAKDLVILREEIAALKGNANAFEALAMARAEEKAVAEARAKLPKDAALDPIVEAVIRNQVREWYSLNTAMKEAKKVRDTLAGWDGSNPFALPNDVIDRTKTWVESLRDVVGVAQLIAQAFGGVGQATAQALNGAQAIAAGLDRANSVKDRAGNSVGLTGALSGAGGAAGVVTGLGAVGAVVAGVAQIADALDLFGKRAAARREQLTALAEDFDRSLAAVTRSLRERGLGETQAAINALAEQFGSLLSKAAAAAGFDGAAFGGSRQSAASLEQYAAQLRAQEAATLATMPRRGAGAASALEQAAQLRKLAEEVSRLATEAAAAEEALRREREAALATRSEDLAVRALRARGAEEEADRLARQLTQQRELAEAEKAFAGTAGLQEYLRALAEVQAAETAAAEAARALAAAEQARQQAQQREAFGLDLTARRQTLNGDARGALITRGQIGNASALAQAEDLVRAGTITAAMFEELRVLLGDELTQAIKDFDDAVAKAKQQQQDDLAVRALVAQGRDREAAQLRIDIANRNELAGVTDEALRQQILQVQALEAEARQRAELVALQAQIAEQMAGIDRRMLDALRELDPAKAAELEAKLREVERTKELADAANETVRARLEELYALQDQAAAHKQLTDELNKQADAARALADLTASVDLEYLRATGRGFDADVQQLKDDRERRLKEATSVGASQDTIDKINAIFDAKYNALIASTMAQTAAAVVEQTRQSDPNTEFITSAVARAISGADALRLIDVAVSQLDVLRTIARNTEGGGAGGVRITVQVTGTFTGTAAENGRAVADQIAPLLQDSIGRRAGLDMRLAGRDAL